MHDVFPALADDVRRQILERLHVSPLAVNEIAELFPITRPAISRHLRILREAGLIRVDSDGRQRRCHLETAGLAEVERWLGQFRVSWDQRFDALETEVARTKRERRAMVSMDAATQASRRKDPA